jgi:hypothetical protein
VRGRIYEKEKGRASQAYFREYFREKGGDGDNRTHGRDSNKPWNEVLDKYKGDIYLVETPNNTGFEKIHISNSLMYSKSGNDFWKTLFIELEMNKELPYYYNRHSIIMFTTGPGVLNRVFNKYKIKYKLNYYPYKLFHPYGLKNDIKIMSENSDVYAVHLGRGSWETYDSKILIFFYQEWKIILFIILILLIPALKIKFMSRPKNINIL